MTYAGGRVTEGQVGSGASGTTIDREMIDLATSEADEAWLARTRVFLTPIAAPSIMGLAGFAIATGMVGAWQAGWYGGPTTGSILMPFALFAGGLLQAIAAIVAFRARDGVAVGMHTIWGSFWLAWGFLMMLVTFKVMPTIPFGSLNRPFGMWFVLLAVFTISGTLAAFGSNVMMGLVLATLSAGSALTAASFFGAGLTIAQVGGWLFVVSAGLAWLAVTAMMLEESWGRVILPLGKLNAVSNIPLRAATRPIQREAGMPGVRVGQ